MQTRKRDNRDDSGSPAGHANDPPVTAADRASAKGKKSGSTRLLRSPPRSGHKKSPDLAVRGCGVGRFRNQPRACNQLLGCGSAGSGSGSSVSSSLGSVSGWSSSVSSRCGGRSCSVGSSRRCGFGGRSRGCGRGFHRCGSRCSSGLFLLATSGECSSSDQGGQNEGVLHFDFPIGTDRILKSHGVRLTGALVRIGTMHLVCTFLAQLLIILVFSQY